MKAEFEEILCSVLFSVCRPYLWVSYGRHVVVQFIRVEGDGGQAVDVCVGLRKPPLHQAGEAISASKVYCFRAAGVHQTPKLGEALTHYKDVFAAATMVETLSAQT